MRRNFLALLLLLGTPAWAQTFALRAGSVIDPASGTEARNQIVLVRDGKIVAVGANVAVPPEAIAVDLSREWLLPGLMDAHTHLTLEWSPPATLESGYLQQGSPQRALRGLRNGQDLLRAGITTVRDVGNEADYASIALKRAIEAGWFDGPTILTSGKIITPFGGQSHDVVPEAGPFWRFEYLDADGPGEIRKAVRRNIYYGADLIKLVADNNDYAYSEEEIHAAVDEAHKAGRAVAVHAFFDAPARNAILAGADSIEHGFQLTEPVLRLMKEKGTFLVGTDLPEAHLQAADLTSFGMPPAAVLARTIRERLALAYRLGVKMAFGTDLTSELPGKNRADMLWDYLGVWRAAGVPPADILKCMTSNAAELLRLRGQRGAIAAGLAADIVAVPANPLEDIEALRKINFVMKNGKIIRRTEP